MNIICLLQKTSLVPSYLWDKMWDTVWKRCMKQAQLHKSVDKILAQVYIFLFYV